jgi:hypothetical protein
MKRRNFLTSTTVAGAGLVFAPFNLKAINQNNDFTFLTEKGNPHMIFPRPLNGLKVGITPPGLAWYPAPEANAYRVEIKNEKGRIAYQKDIPAETVHLPDQVLKPGEYKWNIYALDANGNVAGSRGEETFTITNAAEELPWVSPKELLSRVPKEHSRVVFLKSKMPEYKKRLATTHKAVLNALVEEADSYLNIGLPPFPEYHKRATRQEQKLGYKSYFHLFRKYVDGAMKTTAQAWLFTGEEKYLNVSKSILLEIASWPQDYDNVTSVSINGADEPGLSYSRYAHQVYDWLYEALDPAEREVVFKMCEARAWHVHRRLNEADYLTNSGDSHNGRLIAYLTEMAIAMAHESEGAETWLEYSLKALTTIYPHWGGVEGGWAEGVPYGLWYNSFYIPPFDTLLETTGYDLWKRPFFSKIRYFFIYCASPKGEIRPFGDSAENAGPGAKGGEGYATLMNYHAQRFNDPHALWWVNQTYEWSGSKDIHSVVFDGRLKPEPPVNLPNSRIFSGVGWAGMHSNLADPDNDTFMLFKSSPYGSVSHSHGDQNGFAIMKGGVPLAIPSGYYGPAYGQPHHAKWTRSSKANNCILVNGEGQVLRSDKASGNIVKFEDEKSYTYLLGDATPAYGGNLNKCLRHVLFLRPGIFLMLDELEAPQEANFQWMLHALEEMKIKENRIISKRKDARLTSWVSSTDGVMISQTDRFDTPYNEGIPKEFQTEKPNHWHVTVETKRKRKICRIASILVVDDTANPIESKCEEHNGWLNVKSSGNFGTVEGWIQLSTESGNLAGIDINTTNSKIVAKDAENEFIRI